MNCKDKGQENTYQNQIIEEETINNLVDENGDTWIKVYVGGGNHFKNWLDQCVELKGKENVKVEEAESTDFRCFEESGEKMYRIWVKDTDVK